MEQHAGGVDHRRIGGDCAGAESVEDLRFECSARSFDIVIRNLTGCHAAPKRVNCGPTGFHDGRMAVILDGRPQEREVEQAMNRGNEPEVGSHGRYSIVVSGVEIRSPIAGRNGWS